MYSSPTSMWLTCTVGTMAVPVKPVTRMLLSVVSSESISCAVRAVIAERLAPVSSTMRYGPLPSIITGAQMRPMRSRRVGAAYFGSVVWTMTSVSSSCTAGSTEGVVAVGTSAPTPSGTSRAAPRKMPHISAW